MKRIFLAAFIVLLFAELTESQGITKPRGGSGSGGGAGTGESYVVIGSFSAVLTAERLLTCDAQDLVCVDPGANGTFVIAFLRTATLAGNPTLAANECTFSTNGIICEGSTADAIEGLLTLEDPTSIDKTWTLPNLTGTFLLNTSQNAGTDVTQDLEEETHASEHDENAADELLVENLGTGCTENQIPKANASGGLVCAADGGGGNFINHPVLSGRRTMYWQQTVFPNADLDGAVGGPVLTTNLGSGGSRSTSHGSSRFGTTYTLSTTVAQVRSYTASTVARRNYDPKLTAFMKSGTITNAAYIFCLENNNTALSGLQSGAGTQVLMCLTFHYGLNSSKWACMSCDGTNCGFTDTMVAGASDTEYTLTLEGSSSQISCTVNGTNVTRNLTLPDGTTSLYVHLGIGNTTTTAVSMILYRVALEQN